MIDIDPMRELATLLPLGLALAIGLLIGVERGWRHRDDAAGSRVAGIRTFGILGLLGGCAGLTPLLPASLIIAAAALALLAGFLRQRPERTDASATSILTALLTLLLGYLAVTGMALAALASAVAATLLLSMREEIHRWLRGLNVAEVQAISRFALLAVVILPLLPDRDYGPLDAWNPRHIWMVVVFVSGFSLLGYVAARRLGAEAGTLATALTGALVSSTAVTLALARRLREDSVGTGMATAGIAVASAMMFLRVTVLVGVLAPFAFGALVALMLPAGLVAVLIAVVATLRSRHGGQDGAVRLGNPFDLRPAFLLAILVAILAVAVRWAQLRFGDSGITLFLALTGFADVDAAVIALSTLAPGSISPADAGLALAAPILLNTLLKGAVTIVACPDRRGVEAATPLFIAVAAACAPLLVRFLT